MAYTKRKIPADSPLPMPMSPLAASRTIPPAPSSGRTDAPVGTPAASSVTTVMSPEFQEPT